MFLAGRWFRGFIKWNYNAIIFHLETNGFRPGWQRSSDVSRWIVSHSGSNRTSHWLIIRRQSMRIQQQAAGTNEMKLMPDGAQFRELPSVSFPSLIVYDVMRGEVTHKLFQNTVRNTLLFECKVIKSRRLGILFPSKSRLSNCSVLFEMIDLRLCQMIC